MSVALRNKLKTIVLLGLLSVAVVGLGGLVAPGYLALFALIALAVNLGAYFYSDRLVLKMHRAEPLEAHRYPWIHEDVAELAGRARIPKPRLMLLPDEQPNAFATGRNPEHGVVAVTQGILDVLDRRQLKGVLAHEIAHIKNRDILVATLAAAMAGLVTYVAHAISLANLFGSSDSSDDEGSQGTGLLVALVAPLAATLVQLAVSRSREYLADQTAAALTGDPEALAIALVGLEQHVAEHHHGGASEPAPATASLFIINPLLGGLGRLFSTHPPTEDRVRRLLSLPTAQQPQLPRRRWVLS